MLHYIVRGGADGPRREPENGKGRAMATYKLDDTYRNIKTAEELLDAKETCAAVDQKKELCIGCETWGILIDGQRGQMSRWPDGRGAYCSGGDSDWGTWRNGILYLDDKDGGEITEDGEIKTDLSPKQARQLISDCIRTQDEQAAWAGLGREGQNEAISAVQVADDPEAEAQAQVNLLVVPCDEE